MKIRVCTGMWGAKRLAYAKTFIPGFAKHWPANTDLVVYSDGPIDMGGAGGQCRPLEAVDGYQAFLDRHAGDLGKNGRLQLPQHRWKPRFAQAGYNFKFDAVKFAGQGFIPEAAAADLVDGEILVWIDADVLTHTDVPPSFVQQLLGVTDGAYLGRNKHSEIGFWAVRLNNLTRPMLAKFADLYRTDQVFDLGEWHSAYVWDHCRRLAQQQGAKFNNISTSAEGHVWFTSPLARYMDHLKGEARKRAGRSPERR